jgi:hypothetical protein
MILHARGLLASLAILWGEQPKEKTPVSLLRRLIGVFYCSILTKASF